MRMTMRFLIPVERGNQTFKDGSLEQTIEALVTETNAEAAYFMLEGGERPGYVFFELDDVTRLPKLNEQMFATLDAAVDIVPALTVDDLKRGLSASQNKVPRLAS